MRDIPSFRAISYERLRRCATTYNDFGDVVLESVSGLYTKTLSRHRDSYGRELGYTLDNSRKNIIEYEIDTGRTKRVMFAGAWYTYGYLPGTDLKSSLMVGSAGRTDWTYEPNRDLLTQVKNTAFGSIVSQYDYVNDAVGRRTEIARSGSRMTESRNDIYGYNNRNELTNAVKNATLNEYAYQYDDIGNRIAALDLGTNHTYTANALNQYTQISNLCDSASLCEESIPSFDLDGDQTLVRTPTGDWSVTYNGENRPVLWSCGSTNITMKFDRMGRRVEYIETMNGATNTHYRFVYDGFLCIQRLDALSNNTVDLAFGWDPTEPVATRPLWMQRVSGTYNFFYFHDGNKNVSDLVSYQSVRGVPAHYEYAPFGALTDATTNTAFTAFNAATTNPFRFSSEYADAALGLVYYNYRHYEPVTGRWLSRDPLNVWRNINIMSFSDNNPLACSDMFGLLKRDQIKEIMSAIVNCKEYDPDPRWDAALNVLLAELMGKKDWKQAFIETLKKTNSLLQGINGKLETIQDIADALDVAYPDGLPGGFKKFDELSAVEIHDVIDKMNTVTDAFDVLYSLFTKNKDNVSASDVANFMNSFLGMVGNKLPYGYFYGEMAKLAEDGIKTIEEMVDDFNYNLFMINIQCDCSDVPITLSNGQSGNSLIKRINDALK